MKFDLDEVLHWVMMAAAVLFCLSFTLLWISIALYYLDGQ